MLLKGKNIFFLSKIIIEKNLFVIFLNPGPDQNIKVVRNIKENKQMGIENIL